MLRNIAESMPSGSVIAHSHKKAWALGYSQDGVKISAAVRLGLDWWNYLGGPATWIEVSTAFIRACIQPAMDDVQSDASIPPDFNVAILQRSQLEWLLLAARHFCDDLMD